MRDFILKIFIEGQAHHHQNLFSYNAMSFVMSALGIEENFKRVKR